MRNKRIVTIGALIGIGALIFLYVLQPFLNSKQPNGGTIKTTRSIPTSTEIPFTQEGELWFLTSNGDTIKELALEIADNDYERARGLMDRKTMTDRQAMIFIFDEERPQSFWMKNTQISLDIIYVKANLEVVSIQKNTQPYSTQSLPSKGNAQYVVEVIAGFCDKYGVKEGSTISFVRN